MMRVSIQVYKTPTECERITQKAVIFNSKILRKQTNRQKAGARTVTGPSRLDSCLFPELRQLTALLPLTRHPREPPSRPATEQELQMSTDSLKMPAEVLLPAGVPSRCRETARRDAEVVEEDRFLAAERPLTVLQSCSESDIRSTAGDLEAAEDSQRVMSAKKAVPGKPAAAEFTRCYGCKSCCYITTTMY